MQTLYQKVMTYKGDDIKVLLQNIGLLEIFDDVFSIYAKDVHEAIVMYIVNTYSKDSPLLYIGGSTWKEIKENCAKQACVPKEYWNEVVYLGGDLYDADEPVIDTMEDLDVLSEGSEDALNPKDLEKQKHQEELDKTRVVDNRMFAVVDCINNFLDHQDAREHRHLSMLNDQYEEMMAAAMRRIKKDGTLSDIDYKAKRECRQDATKILEEIKEFEKKMKDEDVVLQGAKQELEKRANNKRVIRPETFAK